MKKLALAAGVALVALTATAYAGPATDSFCGPDVGNGCELGADLMVFLNKGMDVTSGTGNVGGPSALPIMQISSDGGMLDMFIDIKDGFATITPSHQGGTFNGIDITIPGFTFTGLIFSDQLTPNASPSFTATGFSGAHVSDGTGTLAEVADTDKQYGIFDTISPFDEVDIRSLTGFDEIKHIEVDGLQPLAAVPEPGSLALFGSALVGLWACVAYRRRKGGSGTLSAA